MWALPGLSPTLPYIRSPEGRLIQLKHSQKPSFSSVEGAGTPGWAVPHQRDSQQEQPPCPARSLLCCSPQFADLCLKHRQLNYMGADAAKCIKALKCQA